MRSSHECFDSRFKMHLHWPTNHYLRMNGNNEENDFIEIIKISIFLIFMATLYSLYKFNFDFSKVKILSIL